MKYQNKHGIELSYEGHENDVHAELVKEVLRAALKIGDELGWEKAKGFLKLNIFYNIRFLHYY